MEFSTLGSMFLCHEEKLNIILFELESSSREMVLSESFSAICLGSNFENFVNILKVYWYNTHVRGEWAY